jgi:dynactin complex subunit
MALLIRYLGPVGFADGIWVGMEVSGPPLQGNANDGMVFGVR